MMISDCPQIYVSRLRNKRATFRAEHGHLRRDHLSLERRCELLRLGKPEPRAGHAGAVARPEEREFRGFSISNDGGEWRIAPKALDTFRTRVRKQTLRTRELSLPQIIEELAPYLIGWRSYFGFCQTSPVLMNLEAWICRRLRSYLWRQGRNGQNRFKELRR
jgi:hypothetical protein